MLRDLYKTNANVGSAGEAACTPDPVQKGSPSGVGGSFSHVVNEESGQVSTLNDRAGVPDEFAPLLPPLSDADIRFEREAELERHIAHLMERQVAMEEQMAEHRRILEQVLAEEGRPVK